jgi:protein SCO1/2
MSEPSTSPGAGPHWTWPKLIAPLVVLLALVTLLTVLLIGGPRKATLPGGVHASAPGLGYLGTLTLPVRRAPAIALRNDEGQRVTLAQYRGRAVLVTFLYANCPDVCPLIASNLRVALKLLGARATQAQLIAVSVDPSGDTRQAVARFVRAHQLGGRMQYLIGSAGELARTWRAWSVGSQRDVAHPSLVAHSALVYGISASGRLTTVYPASFEPSEIAHDVPLLAAH